jgi:excisionase family DNA binding protein
VMDRDEFYTVGEAAKVLGRGQRWVRQLALDGVIEGERTAEGWQLLRSSVHEFRDQNPPTRTTPEAPVWPPEALAKALSKVEALQRELGRLEGRLQITEVAESTLREQLERERERANEERKRADEERGRVTELEEELRAARMPWWRRVFGG